MATSIDAAFSGIKDQGAGLYIWRIEQLKPVPVEKEGHGKFFAGDSYICLEAKQARKMSSALSYNIHFWLGEATTHDEMGACAYKTWCVARSRGPPPPPGSSFFVFLFFVFCFFPSHLLSSHFCLSPSIVVTQIRGHKAGSSPPSPLRYAPSLLSREE